LATRQPVLHETSIQQSLLAPLSMEVTTEDNIIFIPMTIDTKNDQHLPQLRQLQLYLNSNKTPLCKPKQPKHLNQQKQK